jgi:hypothetical protein
MFIKPIDRLIMNFRFTKPSRVSQWHCLTTTRNKKSPRIARACDFNPDIFATAPIENGAAADAKLFLLFALLARALKQNTPRSPPG